MPELSANSVSYPPDKHLQEPLLRVSRRSQKGCAGQPAEKCPHDARPRHERLRKVAHPAGSDAYSGPAVPQKLGSPGTEHHVRLHLHCFNCNRSCEQARTNDHMSVAQIRHFLAESRDRGQKWRMIRVIGGEPTIHPIFLEIIGLLAEYRRTYSPAARIVVCTNGYGDKVRRMLAMLPPEIVVENSSKDSPVQTGVYEV